jgi:hypothetical protein
MYLCSPYIPHAFLFIWLPGWEMVSTDITKHAVLRFPPAPFPLQTCLLRHAPSSSSLRLSLLLLVMNSKYSPTLH